MLKCNRKTIDSSEDFTHNNSVRPVKYMKINYFIDSENVGDSWITLLDAADTDDEILVFYTLKSPHMNYRNIILLKNSPKDVTFIECIGGNNGLDFQLTTELGYRIALHPDEEYIIFSNDAGFDAVVKYWIARGISVSRTRSRADASAAAKKTAEEPVSAEKKEIPAEEKEAKPARSRKKSTREAKPAVQEAKDKPEPEAAAPAPEQPAAPSAPSFEDSAREILYCVGKDDLESLYEALKQIYGDERCKSIYKSFKQDTAYREFLSNHQPLSAEEKQALYCRILLTEQAPEKDVPDDFASFLMSAWRQKKNLNSLRAALLECYGKTDGGEYYSIVKAHVKILDKFK